MEAVVGARGVYPSRQTVLRLMQSVKVELRGGASAICVLQMILSLMNLFKSFIYRLFKAYLHRLSNCSHFFHCFSELFSSALGFFRSIHIKFRRTLFNSVSHVHMKAAVFISRHNHCGTVKSLP